MLRSASLGGGFPASEAPPLLNPGSGGNSETFFHYAWIITRIPATYGRMLDILFSSLHGPVLTRQIDPADADARFINCAGKHFEPAPENSFWVTWDEPAGGEIDFSVPFERRILCITEPPEYKDYSILLPPHRYILSPFLIHPSALAPGSVVVRTPPLINWHYGVDMGKDMPAPPMALEALHKEPPPVKTKLMAMVCSNIDTLPAHRQRILFMHTLRERFADRMDFFGKGFAFVSDKRQAIYDYKYLLCLENNFHKNFWTEKISDAFLGRAVPVYAGCSNVSDYFPEQSFIRIDYRDPETAAQTIARILDSDSDADYSGRLPYLEEARARLFTHYNAAAALVRLARHIQHNPDCLDSELLARAYLGL